MHYTYVLLCQNKKLNIKDFYVGFTSDLKQRLQTHKAKGVQTTKKFDTITLVYYEASLNEADARKRELQLKTGFGRGYINKRIKGYIEEKMRN